MSAYSIDAYKILKVLYESYCKWKQ